MNSNELSVDELVEKAIAGDNDSFGELVKKYEKLVYNIVYHSVGNHDDAFDISQEIFIKAYRSIKLFRGESQFSTWLYRICQNACKDYIRKKIKDNHISLSDYDNNNDNENDINKDYDIPDNNISSKPDAIYEQNEKAKLIQQAISNLSENHKNVVILRDIEGYSYEDISEKLGIEVGTVKSRLNRARLHVKNYLTKWNIL